MFLFVLPLLATVFDDVKRTLRKSDKELAFDLGLEPYAYSKFKHGVRSGGLQRLFASSEAFQHAFIQAWQAQLPPAPEIVTNRDLLVDVVSRVLTAMGPRRAIKAETRDDEEKRSAR